MLKNLLCIVLVISTTACTTSIESTRLSEWDTIDKNNNKTAVEGLVYHLPATQLKVKATYRLLVCPANAADLSTTPLISLTKGTVSSTTVPDPAPQSTFVIDTSEMTNWLKVVEEAKVELSRGMLKSVTYDAEDKTREFVSAAAGVLLAFGVSPIPTGALEIPVTVAAAELPEMRCNRATIAAISAVQGIHVEIVTQGQVINDQNIVLADPSSTKELISQAKEKIAVATAIIDQLKQTRAAIIAAKLTYEHVDVFIPEPKNPIGSNDQDPALNEWFAKKTDVRSALARKFFTGSNISQHLGNQDIGLRVSVRSETGPFGQPVKRYEGIYYRSPRPVLAVVQRFAPNRPNTYDLIDSSRGDMFQFGITARLPVTNGIFQDNRYVITFADDGRLTSFEYKEDKARAVEATKTVQDVVTKVEDEEKRRLDKETERLKSEKDRINALKELKHAKQELDALENLEN